MMSPVKDTVNKWLAYLDENQHPGAFKSDIDMIREYRTLRFNFPRQTGKTSYLLGKFYTTNSIMFFYNRTMLENATRNHISMARNMHTFGERLIDKYAGTNQVFDHILIDEPGFMKEREEEILAEFIQFLNARNQLSKKFSIIALGTH